MIIVYSLVSIAAGLFLCYLINVAAVALSFTAFYLLVYTIGFNLAYWLYAFVNIPAGLIKTILTTFLAYGKFPWYFLLGYLTGWLGRGLMWHHFTDKNYRKTLRLMLAAVAFASASTFLMATIGKIHSIAFMRTFFHDSGYSNSFLYFIMAAETAGALGVILYKWLKTGLWATAGLLLIMAGAVYTHWHNHDPFSDSYAAIMQLITSGLLLILYLFEKRINAIAIIVGPAE